MRHFTTILVVLLLLETCASHTGIQHANNEQAIQTKYDQFSLMPLIHLMYNTHFRESPHFTNIQAILEQLRDKRAGYLELLFTDCDAQQSNPSIDHDQIPECKSMKQTKDAHYMFGTVPQSSFFRFGDVYFQLPPKREPVKLRGTSSYSVQAIEEFLDGLLPEFYQPLSTVAEFQEFLKPRYVPKLILFQTEDEPIEKVYRILSISFALRFDMGIITDLTDSLLGDFTVPKYPSLAVLQYNFSTNKNQVVFFKQSLEHMSKETLLEEATQFLEQHALEFPRNDLIFHRVQMQAEPQILEFQHPEQWEEIKEKLKGWSLVLRGNSLSLEEKMLGFMETHGQYFSYVRDRSPTQESSLKLYSPAFDTFFELEMASPNIRRLNSKDAFDAISFWCAKEYVVLVVSEENWVSCALIEKPLLRNNTQCIIVETEQTSALEKILKTPIKDGLIVGLYIGEGGNKQSIAESLPSSIFEEAYPTLLKYVKFKVSQRVTEFLTNPVTEVGDSLNLHQLCDHPFKFCGFLLMDLSKKDNTLAGYVSEYALHSLNTFTFYRVDSLKNPQLMASLGLQNAKKASLVLYDPRRKLFSVTHKINKSDIPNFAVRFLNRSPDMQFTSIDPNLLITYSTSQPEMEQSQEL